MIEKTFRSSESLNDQTQVCYTIVPRGDWPYMWVKDHNMLCFSSIFGVSPIFSNFDHVSPPMVATLGLLVASLIQAKCALKYLLGSTGPIWGLRPSSDCISLRKWWFWPRNDQVLGKTWFLGLSVANLWCFRSCKGSNDLEKTQRESLSRMTELITCCTADLCWLISRFSCDFRMKCLTFGPYHALYPPYCARWALRIVQLVIPDKVALRNGCWLWSFQPTNPLNHFIFG